jgi:hypothetical protein
MKKYDKIQEFLTYGISLLSGVVCASVYITHSDTYLYAAPIIGVLLMIKLIIYDFKTKG